MNWFDVFSFGATAGMQIAFTALIVWLVASNWLFDRKLIIVSTGLATVLVASSLPFHDDRLSRILGIILVVGVGCLIGAAWLKRHEHSMDTTDG